MQKNEHTKEQGEQSHETHETRETHETHETHEAHVLATEIEQRCAQCAAAAGRKRRRQRGHLKKPRLVPTSRARSVRENLCTCCTMNTERRGESPVSHFFDSQDAPLALRKCCRWALEASSAMLCGAGGAAAAAAAAARRRGESRGGGRDTMEKDGKRSDVALPTSYFNFYQIYKTPKLCFAVVLSHLISITVSIYRATVATVGLRAYWCQVRV